jgi:glycosyltransferase involved in cell wall biosynthesis
MAREDGSLTAARPAPKVRTGQRVTTRYSLIVPVYKNEAFIGELIARCERLNHALGGALEVVIVVDGSPDRSYEKLAEALPSADFASRLVALSRNFGSFAAIRAGLQLARGPYFTMMAADLQEPEQLVLDTFAALDSGD